MKRIFLTFMFCPWICGAAATIRGIYPNASQSAFASAASVTWIHNQPDTTVCPDNVLVVACGNDASTFSSIRYQGIDLTQRVHLTSTETMDIWTLTNSTATGTNNIIATNGAAVNVICGAVTFCGALVATPVDATATAQATGTNPSLAVTVVSSGSYAVFGGFNNGTTINDTPRSQVNTIQSLFNNGGPSTMFAYIDGPFTSGSKTLSVTEPTSAAWTKAVMSIRPSTGTPIVLTLPPTAVTQTSFTGNGVLLSTAGFTLTEEGVCISTTPNPTTSDTCVTATGTPFTANFTGLAPATQYYARAYGKSSPGTDYGVNFPIMTIGPIAQFSNKGTGNAKLDLGSGAFLIK